MKTKSKNQHFVPQFYLRHFCGENEKLFVFDKPQEKVFQSPTDQVAASKYFYDLPISFLQEGTDPQIVEHELAKAEDRFSVAMNNMIRSIERDGVLCVEARPVLAEFMAMQVMRTRDVRTQLQQLDKLLEIAVGDNCTPEFRAKYLSGSDDHSYVQAKLLFGDAHHETQRALNNHIWMGAYNPTSLPLITSDCPIIRNVHIQNELMPATGYASPGIELFIPLTSKMALVLFERNFHAACIRNEMRVLRLTEENVNFYNGHQVLQSDRHLFSNCSEFAGVREVLQRRPDVKNPQRQRSEFIWAGKRIRLDDDG